MQRERRRAQSRRRSVDKKTGCGQLVPDRQAANRTRRAPVRDWFRGLHDPIRMRGSRGSAPRSTRRRSFRPSPRCGQGSSQVSLESFTGRAPENGERPHRSRLGPFSSCVLNVGGDLLSHTLTSAVPSALEGLATGFGMGPGVPPPPQPPTTQSTIEFDGFGVVVCSGSHSGCEQRAVEMWVSPRPISTGRLHPSQGFHLQPINPIVCGGP